MVREIFTLTKTRQDILSSLFQKPHTISQLSKILGLGRTTISHHLFFLKNKGLIREEKPKKTLGNPIFIHFNIPKKAKPLIIKIIDYIEGLRKKGKPPSTKEKIMDGIDSLNKEDFETAYTILELYRCVGIVITHEGIKLKNQLK